MRRESAGERWGLRMRRRLTYRLLSRTGTAIGRPGRVLSLVTMALMLCAAALGCSNAMATAEGLVAGGDPAGAQAIYEETLAAEPDDLEALTGLAVVLAMQQKYDEALSVQERVIAADPADVQTRVELGFNYLNHQGRSSDAVRVFSEAVALDGSAKHLTFLGQAQISAGQVQEAEQTLERAIGTEPGYAYAYTVLAGLLDDQGRAEEADQVVAQAASQGITISESK
jgi:tetratricopeptide (TPR) repeat protein